MEILSATEVRKHWSEVCDTVIREKPVFVRRTRDDFVIADCTFLLDVLNSYHYTAKRYVEDDGSITLSLNEMDLVDNGPDDQAALDALGADILDYAMDYYNDWSMFYNSTNRKCHLPYVLKALIINDSSIIGGMVQCQNGEN